MDTWLQEERRAKYRERQKSQSLQGVYSGYIVTVNPDDEHLLIRTHGGDKKFPVKHPYLAPDSWIRVMPSPDSYAMLQYRSDTNLPEIVNYANPNQPTLIARYNAEQGAYRPLQPGEMDTTSVGLAQTFHGRRGVRDKRAGIVRTWEYQDEAEVGAKAPIHRRVLHQNDSAKLGDEERFGVVKRSKNGSSNFNTYPKYSGDFAKEHFERVYSVKGTPPILYEKWEGQVFDDNGTPIRQSQSNGLLRLLHKYYANAGNPWIWEIDESGNSAWRLPDSATHGHTLIIPKGNLFQTIEKDWKSSVNNNFILNVTKNAVSAVRGTYTIQVGSNNMTAVLDPNANTIKISHPTGASIEIDSGGIINLSGTSLSATLAENLVQYLDQHIHPTVVGPSGPPIITSSTWNSSPSQSFASKHVKIRSN